MKIMQKVLRVATMISMMLFLCIRNAPAIGTIDKIPQYPGSQPLCNEHVTSPKMHILWVSFSTRDAAPTVAAYFERKLGAKAVVGEHDSLKIVQPDNADLTVTIYPRRSEGSFPTCTQKPEPRAGTIVLISQAIRNQEKAALASVASHPLLDKATEVPIESLIRDNFGPNVEVVKAPKPVVLRGDFNGDGISDLAALVKPKGKRGELLPDVRLVQIAEGAKDPSPETILNGEKSLAVIHGSAAGFIAPKPGDKFLIYAFGWLGWSGPQTGNLVVLPKSKPRDKQGYATVSPGDFVSMPNDNKGAVIVVPTEAGINTLLYWNGKTYRDWVDPGETP